MTFKKALEKKKYAFEFFMAVLILCCDLQYLNLQNSARVHKFNIVNKFQVSIFENCEVVVSKRLMHIVKKDNTYYIHLSSMKNELLFL